MEADVKSHTKIHKRMENVATDRVINRDSFSAQVDLDPMCLTSFGDDFTKPPVFLCSRNDALVDKGAASPKPCLSPIYAHANSRRWLTSRRHSLYSDKDPLSPTAFFSEPRRDQGMYQPDKQPACPSADGGLFKRNQGKLWCSILAVLQVFFAPSRFWEGEARCFVGRVPFGRRIVPETRAFFGRWSTGTSFSKRR